MPGVITIRLSREQHEAAKEAAHRRRMSLNQFCATVLSHGITDAFEKPPVEAPVIDRLPRGTRDAAEVPPRKAELDPKPFRSSLQETPGL